MATFKERLRQLRKSKKLNQTELAKELDVSKSLISMYESGQRTPPIDTLELITDYFNVDFAYILGQSDIPNSFTKEQDDSFIKQLNELKMIQGQTEEYIRSQDNLGNLWNPTMVFEIVMPIIKNYASRRILKLVEITDDNSDIKEKLDTILDKTFELYNTMIEEGFDRMIKLFEVESSQE